MRTVTRLEGRTALITGAASGIGRALAATMAARGINLALVDVDERGLAETTRRVAGADRRVSAHCVDLARREAIVALPASIRAAHPTLDILVNNAGVALAGRFDETEDEDVDWLFAVNFFAVTRMTRAFLPMLRSAKEARIVNVSSLFGLIAVPDHATYVASKFAVRGFSESLRHELAGTRIGVSTVYPGGVATSIAANARAPNAVPPGEAARRRQAFAKHLTMPPEDAAAAIVRGIERRRARIVIGRDAKIAAGLERLLPVRHVDVLLRFGNGLRRRGDRAGGSHA